jgi:hypothetical protein
LLPLDNTDSGNAVPRKEANRTPASKVRVTDLNWGLDALRFAFLKPIEVATTRLQTVGQPIQHRVARILRKLRRDVASFPGDPREPFIAWRKCVYELRISQTSVVLNTHTIFFLYYYCDCRESYLDGQQKASLVAAVGRIGSGLTSACLASYDRRLKPYLAYYAPMGRWSLSTRPALPEPSLQRFHSRTYLQVNFPKVREEELLAMHSELGDGTTQIRENRCVIEGPLISPRPNDGRATISKTGEFSDLGEVKLPYPYGFSPR